MLERIRKVLPFVAVAMVASGAYVGLVWAPPDREMGDVQRIMYAHVPSVWMAFLCLTTNFICSVTYLFTSKWGADALSEATAEVGVVFGTIGVSLGAIWGRPTWGVWWTWDPRLTTTAIMLMLYTGYLALRAFTEDPERRARWSAAVGILAFLNVPIVYMSVRWWRTLHQPQSSPATVDTAYAWGLRTNAIAVLLILVYLIGRRYHAAALERAAETRREEIALTGGRG